MKSHGAATKRRGLVFVCGLLPVLATAVLAVYRPGLVPRADDAVYDTVMRSARIDPPGNHVVIVDIDERSLSTIGQWPWRRDIVGALIARLRDLGASVVALDIIFAEPDRLVMPASNIKASATTPDEVLSDVLRDGRVVLGYALTFDRGAQPATSCVLHPIGLAVVHPREETGGTPYFHATSAVCSLPALAQAAKASGFLNAAPDPDGILRRVPVVAELNGRVYPSLALAAVSAATGARDMTLRVANVNAATLAVDTRNVPLDGRSNLLARYRGKKGTFPHLSAADVLSGKVHPDTVRNRIVFVGTTALGTREVVATPLDTLFVGVEVQATIADNLMERTFIRKSALGSILDSQLTLVLGLLIAALVASTGVIPGVIGGVAGIVAMWSGSAWLLSARGLFVSPLFPTLGVVSGLALMTVAKVTIERLRADAAGRQTTDAHHLMVQTLLSLTATRDAETGRHSRRTQRYARILAEELSHNPEFRGYFTRERIDLLSSLAPIHDIGKVGIPDHILNKPGALTPEELAEMRTHPALGRDVILKAEHEAGVHDDVTLAMAKDIVYTHHERWDGSGYPQGLAGKDIPVPGRVMAIVDVYDAVVSRTLYRDTMSHADTVKFIASGRGTHFDPAVVDAFVRVAAVIERVARDGD
jgi:HD-GYP domain-containing protein (c-di-GMP phosphodiesterase class II)